MDPGVEAASQWNQLGEGVKCADIEIACLEHDDGRAIWLLGQRLMQRCGEEPPLFIVGKLNKRPRAKT